MRNFEMVLCLIDYLNNCRQIRQKEHVGWILYRARVLPFALHQIRSMAVALLFKRKIKGEISMESRAG